MSDALFARLVGVLSLHDGAGRDCTPRSNKARGIVALLALTPDRKRSRRWIEAKLWSDRGPDQASGSLRQALMDLRTSLGPAAGALQTDREFVRLAGLATDIETRPEATRALLAAGRDLLEGIDLRDQAFEAWLRDERSRLAGHAPRSLPPDRPHAPAIPLTIRTGMMPDGFGGFVALALGDAIGGLVSEFASVDVFSATGATLQLGPQEQGLLLNIDASESNGQLHVMTTMGATRTGQVLWSRRAVLPLAERELLVNGEFPGIVFEAAEAAMQALPRLVGSDSTVLQAEALVARAVREMFTFDQRRLRLADTLLTDAARINPSARIFAWHGLLRQIMVVERTDPNRAQLLDDASGFARQAMTGAPTNSVILSLVSQLQIMLRGNTETGAAFADNAVARSGNNPFAHAAKASSLLLANRPADALASAQYGAKLASRSGYLQWWEAIAGLAYVSMGNFPDAISIFEAANTRAPYFRSPLRHLLFLYLKTGEIEKARRVLGDLRRIEPDFSFERVRDDPDYPAGTLRRMQLDKLSMPEG